MNQYFILTNFPVDFSANTFVLNLIKCYGDFVYWNRKKSCAKSGQEVRLLTTVKRMAIKVCVCQSKVIKRTHYQRIAHYQVIAHYQRIAHYQVIAHYQCIAHYTDKVHYQCIFDTEAKMHTIRKTMKTIHMRARRISITAVIPSGALSVNTKEILIKYSPGQQQKNKKNKK